MSNSEAAEEKHALECALNTATDAAALAEAHRALSLYFGRQRESRQRDKHAQQSVVGVDGVHDNGLAEFRRATDILSNRKASTYGLEILTSAVDELSDFLGHQHPFVYYALGRLSDHLRANAPEKMLQRLAIYQRLHDFAMTNYGSQVQDGWKHLEQIGLLRHQLGDVKASIEDLDAALCGLCACLPRADARPAFEKVSELDLPSRAGSESRQRDRETLLTSASIGDDRYEVFLVSKWRVKRDPALGRLFSRRCVDSESVIDDISRARCRTSGSETMALLLVDAYHKERLRLVDADYVAWQAIELVAEYQTAEESNDRTEADEGALEQAESNWQWQLCEQLWLESQAVRI
jgi:hypothetical protein